MKTILIAAAALATFFANAQEFEQRKIGNFTSIEAANDIEVVFTESDKNELRVVAPSELQEGIVTELRGSDLRIYARNGERTQKVKVLVSGQNISKIKAKSGASIVFEKPLFARNVTVEVGSDAKISATIAASNISLTALSGSICNVRVQSRTLNARFAADAKVNLSGNAVFANLYGEGHSFVNAKNFIAKTLGITAKDRAELQVYSGENLSLKLDDHAKVVYKGTPLKLDMNDRAVASKSQPNTVIAQN